MNQFNYSKLVMCLLYRWFFGYFKIFIISLGVVVLFIFYRYIYQFLGFIRELFFRIIIRCFFCLECQFLYCFFISFIYLLGFSLVFIFFGKLFDYFFYFKVDLGSYFIYFYIVCFYVFKKGCDNKNVYFFCQFVFIMRVRFMFFIQLYFIRGNMFICRLEDKVIVQFCFFVI